MKTLEKTIKTIFDIFDDTLESLGWSTGNKMGVILLIAGAFMFLYSIIMF